MVVMGGVGTVCCGVRARIQVRSQRVARAMRVNREGEFVILFSPVWACTHRARKAA